jgi:hypothetical protein
MHLRQHGISLFLELSTTLCNEVDDAIETVVFDQLA